MISSPTLVHRLAELAARRPRRVAFRFLVTGEVDGPIDEVNYRELWRRVSGLGAGLRDAQLGGQRALLLFPPGLDYVTAFLACLHAGVVAVPVYPPDPTRLERTLPRLRAIAEDCDAQAVLTLTSIEALRDGVAAHAPELARLEWIAADRYGPSACDWLAAPDLSPETLALLQYTSGSTGSPRGVMVRHRNLMANGAQIHAALGLVDGDVNVSWLPPYHDMGLIGGILQTIYSGLSGVLMAPTAFLERPARWLRAISRFRGVLSGGPNFAYDLCVRKVTPAERVELDLSSWRIAFNGAEPVRWRTVQRFLEAFTPCGLRREAPLPCYGLAEVTLFASGGPTDEEPQALDVDEAALARMRVAPRAGGYPVVCCGRAAIDQDVRVVDPKTRAPVEPDGVGELWIGGPHVTGGYWGRTEETAATFAARLTTGEGPFLRTGDLGFVRDGALYITGRIKDVIIIRGRNLWPQDLERAVEESHPAVRSGGVAAFAQSDGGDERLGILAEVRARDGLEELVAAIRQAVAERHGVTPRTVALIAPGRLPKTSSGKVRRSASRALIQDEQAPLLWRDDADELEAVAQGTPAMSVLLASSDAEAAGDLYGLVLEAARRAEQLGFTAVWLPERHFHGVGGLFPNPATVAAAVAARTERIHIRAGSVIMPLHDPLRVAEEWAVVDRLSGGRVGVAFATGSSADDFVLAPDRFASRSQATCAGVEIVRQLWRGESITRRDGNGEDVAVQVFPRPLREPPLWLTCGAEEERFVEAGARGFHVLAALQFQTPEELARKIAAYRDARERAGHNPAAGHVTLMLHTFVGETGAEVDALVNAPLRRYLERSVALWRRGAAELEALRPAEREAALSFALRRYRQQSSLIGTAPECAAMLERLRAAGVDELACLIDFGIPRAAALAGLERLDRVRRGDVVVTRARASSRPEPAMTARQRQLAAIIRDEATRVFGRAVPVGDQVALQALGLDSLKAVELSQRLGERMQRALTATLWFDYPTVGAAAERIARLEAGHDEVTAAAFDVLTDATLPADIIARGAPVPHAGSPRRVLLTGATGFVGAYLLRELLDRTRAQVVCLVRARDEAAALARIEATLTEYGLWDPGLAARIEPLVGDLAAPGLGLDDAARDALAGDLDLIYHNGAIVNFALSYAGCRAANVLGTLEVLRLACRGPRAVPVHHVSTIAVFSSAYAGQIVTPRDEPRDHRRLDMGYSRSKWAAEQLVVAAKARGVPARVYRLGLVTGASDTGACHLTNFVWNVIRVSVELGSLPDYDRVIDMAPVDWVARSLVRASLEAGDDTLHLVNLAPTSIFGLRRWLERRGYEMRVESFERWHVRLFQRVIATPSLSPLLPVLSLTSAEFYARAQVRYDRLEAGAFAEASGDACPPADDALLDTYLHYFRDRGFLPRPGERRPAPEARVALDGLRLRELVVEITGFPERDGERLHAPLTALLPEMRAQQYREDGLSRASTRLLLALIRRARIGELRRRHPEIAEIPVERPLIIAAPPRTGTTLLHNLLALEPSNHAFALWELMHPVNPTRAGASWAAHVQGVTAELIAETYERSPDLRAIHPLRAEAPDECSWLLSATATSLVNAVCAHAPGYAAWLLSTDMRPAYRFHREAVQALLWRRPGAQLVLKDPWHLWHLDALLDTYPDATVVLLHRDMRAVVPSLCSLTRALIAIEAAPPPYEVIGRRCLELLEQGITRMLRTRTLLPGAFVDVDYRALVADPIGAARAIQEASGRALSPAGERAMRQWLIDNPPNAHGPHRYDLATFGLDPADVDARFAEYTARFLR